MRILVVEDEKRLAEAICQILSEQKYMVDIASDGKQALEYALDDIYDVIILDIMLPIMDGLSVVTELRKRKIQVPVLMLTAKTSITDKVAGLDCGADDYMTKPFDVDELLARVRALARRQGEVILDEIVFGDLTLNITTCNLECNKKNVHLNYKEFEILKLFMSSPKVVLSKEDLILKVWGYDSNAGDNNVEAYISFLRRKMSYLKSNVRIVSLRKIGYRIEVEENVS